MIFSKSKLFTSQRRLQSNTPSPEQHKRHHKKYTYPPKPKNFTVKGKNFLCLKCVDSFSTNSSVCRHIRKCTGIERRVKLIHKCSDCSLVFSARWRLTKHARACETVLDYTRQKCSKGITKNIPQTNKERLCLITY